jgi:hypothetical protein
MLTTLFVYFDLIQLHICYKQEGRGLETRQGELILFFLIYVILSAPLGPDVYWASNRNEYQKQENNVSVE